ncbi:hypothetical protein F5Y11DRAFT_351833 [Daldinia sp. FL1419]|nr:hypothetical protein F5Y11DRAFT_351833 [Daldinia sp. FL1419]
MFTSLTTKLAMKKVGLSSDALDFSSSKTSRSNDGSVPGLDDLEESNSGWPAWMIPIVEYPKPGDLAPIDRDRQLSFGGGKPTIVLFLRCVGCAFAQKSFLALRDLAIKNQGKLTCIAVSHSSREATRKWLDILGGAWNVEVVIDEDRAIYAAWGLGLGNIWYMFNPTTQIQGWKEKGWLGIKVANSVQRTNSFRQGASNAATTEENEGPSTVMGNKWQQAGLFSIDGSGVVIWAMKALRADDMMDLAAAATAIGIQPADWDITK